MDYLISEETANKLREKHHVFLDEVIECFDNRRTRTIDDTRDEHRTFPPTKWFIGETNAGRRLKVVFIKISETETVIRTAYPPDDIEEEIYERKAKN